MKDNTDADQLFVESDNELLACPICYEQFTNEQRERQPRQLKCTHLVCSGCLEQELQDCEAFYCVECFDETVCTNVSELPLVRVKEHSEPTSLSDPAPTSPVPKTEGALSAFMLSTAQPSELFSVPVTKKSPISSNYCIRDGCQRPRGHTGYCSLHAARRLSAASTDGLLKSFSSTFSRPLSDRSVQAGNPINVAAPTPPASPLHPEEMAKLFATQDIVEFEKAWEVIEQARVAFSREPNRLQLTAPLAIVGDIHGQYFDMMQIFDLNGRPPIQSYLFLGDYVDRGKFSCEVMLYLLALKLTFPEHIHMLRGNHESANVSSHFGFKDECKAKYGQEYGSIIYNRFVLCFQCIPLCATVDTAEGKVFAVHGGISPDLRTLKDIDDLDRFVEPQISGPLCDLLWSDPLNEKAGRICGEHKRWLKNDVRGCSFYYSEEAVDDFLQSNDILSIIRAHEVQPRGYEQHFPRPGSGKNSSSDESCATSDRTNLIETTLTPVVTVFSAPNYCGRYGNKAAILILSKVPDETSDKGGTFWKQYESIPEPERKYSHKIDSDVQELINSCPYMPTTFRDLVNCAKKLGRASVVDAVSPPKHPLLISTASVQADDASREIYDTGKAGDLLNEMNPEVLTEKLTKVGSKKTQLILAVTFLSFFSPVIYALGECRDVERL